MPACGGERGDSALHAVGERADFVQESEANPSAIPSLSHDWITMIWPYANTLFALLAVIEFAWSAAVMALEKTDLQSWTSALIRKIMWLGAFYALLLYGRQWIPAIIDSFSQLGGSAAGINGNQGLSPSDVFTQGLNIAAALMDAASSSAFFTNPGTCLAVMLAAALVVIAYYRRDDSVHRRGRGELPRGFRWRDLPRFRRLTMDHTLR